MELRGRDINRAVVGALAGISGTLAMTVVMGRLHRRLSPASQYPLPPREIVQETFPPASERVLRPLTMLCHFGYGAGAGALFALIAPRRGAAAGMVYGAGIWAASYLGWIPALRILTAATHHPHDRNALMIAAHLVWGAATALMARELDRAEGSIFGAPSTAGAVPDRDSTEPTVSTRKQ